MTLYRIELHNITAGIEVSAEGRVIRAAPVFRRLVGARLDSVSRWLIQKGGTMQVVSEEQE